MSLQTFYGWLDFLGAPRELGWLAFGLLMGALAITIIGSADMWLHRSEPSSNFTGLRGWIQETAAMFLGVIEALVMAALSISVVFAPVWFFTSACGWSWTPGCIFGIPIGLFILVNIYRMFGIR